MIKDKKSFQKTKICFAFAFVINFFPAIFKFKVNFISKFVKFQNNEYIQSVGRCLQMMLRVDDYRFAFVSVDGISTLISILSSRVNFQVNFLEISLFNLT